MKKLILLAALLCGYDNAQTTTVSRTVRNPDNSLASGSLTLRINEACSNGSSYIGDQTITVRFSAGLFSVGLIPNDGCVPSSYYTATWQLNGGHAWIESWLVPTSGTPVTVDSVVINSVPLPPTYLVPLQQLAQTGATFGQVPTWNGASYQPATPGSTGGGWAVNVIPFTASPTMDFALGNIQRITLTGNVTSLSTLHIGAAPVTVQVCQDGVGGHSFAWAAAFAGAVSVGANALSCTTQWFLSLDGVKLHAQGIGVINQ